MCPLGVDIERIDRLSGCHEEAIHFAAPEGKVCALLRKFDLPNACAVGCEDVDSVVAIPPPAADAQTLPSVSHRIPSLVPGFMSTNICSLRTVLLWTSKAWIVAGVDPESTTYKSRSSGEKHRPLGCTRSVMTAVAV